jgi:hypothetical protein
MILGRVVGAHPERMHMTRTFILLSSIALTGLAGSPAIGDSYPVSGLWTYRNASAKGAAEPCDRPTMEFRGDYRRDQRGGVPDFRNVSVERTGTSSFAVNDLFLTWPNVRGNVYYSLRLIDEDHIEISIPRAGRTFLLRRCG